MLSAGLTLLTRASRALHRTLDVDAMLNAALADLARAFGADGALVHLFSEDGGIERSIGHWLSEEHGRAVSFRKWGVSQIVRQMRRPLVLHDIAEHRDIVHPAHFAHGVKSLAALPIIGREERALGVLFLYYTTPQRFPDSEVHVLSAYADQLATALENARLFEESERRRKAAEALLEIARALGSTLEVKQVLKMIAQRTAQVIGAERCTIHLRRNGTVLPVMSQFADGRTDPDLWARFKARGPYPVEEAPVLAEAIHTRRPVAIEDTAGASLIPTSWVEAYGVRSTLVVPLILRDAVIGTLGLDQTHGPYAWRQEEIDLAMTIANQAALAIENARLYEETGQRLKQTETLLSVSETVGSTLDLTEVARRTTRELVRALGADLGGAWLVGASQNCFLPLAGYRVPKELLETFGKSPLCFEHPLIEEVIRRDGPIYARDSAADPRFDHPFLRLLPHKSAMIVPVRVKEEIVGGLGIAWLRETHEVTPEELRLAEGISRQAAVAMENARLLEAERKLKRGQGNLLAVARDLATEIDLDRLLPRVAEEARQLIGTDAAVLLLLEGDDLVFRGAAGIEEALTAKGRLDVEECLAWEILQEGRALSWPDLSENPSWRETLVVRQFGYRAMLAVPLRIKDRMLGVIELLHHEPRLFSPEDLVLLGTLATQAALAIENARFFTESEARRQATEALLEISQALGSTLDLRQVLKIIAQRAAQAVGAERCTMTLRQDGQFVPVMSQFADGHADPDLWVKFKAMGPYGLEEIPAIGEAIRARRPVAVDDVSTAAAIPADWPEVFGVRSIMVVAMFLQDEVVGTLHLEQTSAPYAWRPEQLRVAMTVANQAALAVQHARLYQRAEERAEKLTTLSTLTRLMTSVSDNREVSHAIARATTTLLGAKLARVWVDDPASRVLRVQGSFSTDSKFEHVITDLTEIPHGKGLVGTIFESRAPEYLENLHEDPRVLNERLNREADLAAFAGLPLMVGDQVLGVLAVVFGDRRVSTPEEKELMALLADQAAIAINNARLFEETERRRRAAESLAEVGRLISQSLNPGEVAQRIADSVRSFLRACVATVFRLERESQDLLAMAVSGDVGPIRERGLVFPPGTGLMGLAVRERHPVVTSNVLGDPRIVYTPEVRARIEQAEHRAALAVPLLSQDQVIGVLVVGDKAGRVFSEEEIHLARAFAAQAAVALENSRLYGELREALETLEASQQRIVQGERIRALGEMAGGVAHDFNNVLAVILARAQLLHTQSGDPDFQRQLKVIQKAALDGAHTVRRIQEFTRRRRARPFQPVDLNQVVEEVVGLTRSRWKDEAEAKGMSYDVRMEPGPIPPVAGDPSELREALTNILFNALDAMPEGGRLTLTTRVDGDRVSCAVADTGVGMTEEVRKRVFDPFFTTKNEKGNGLGLSMVYGIVNRHGGEIEVEGQPGQGSVFTIRLPVGRDMPEAPAATPPPARTRGAKILVIDDEAEVGELLGEFLSSQGHAVKVCSDGGVGLARLEEEAFDLVVTDLGMPGVSGWQVAGTVKLKNPRTPVVLLTGWGDQIDPAEAQTKGADFVVSKPFTFEDIQAALAAAFTRTAGGDGNRRTS